MSKVQSPSVIESNIQNVNQVNLDVVNEWVALTDAEIKRVVTRAARRADESILWSLTQAYLVVHGSRGSAISANTCRSYRVGIRNLLVAWAGKDLLAPGRDEGALYARLLEASGLSPSSIGIRLTAARQLYKALRWAGATSVDPFSSVRPPRDNTAPWDRRAPYSAKEVKRLLRSGNKVDKVFILLGAHGGLRAGEMINLRWEDIDLSDRILFVRDGKGGKFRSVNLSQSLYKALLGVKEESGSVLPYRTYSRLAKRMYKVCDHANVERRGLHALRHHAGTEIMRKLGDLESVARHLGHSSLETARIYAKWSDSRLKAAVADW